MFDVEQFKKRVEKWTPINNPLVNLYKRGILDMRLLSNTELFDLFVVILGSGLTNLTTNRNPSKLAAARKWYQQGRINPLSQWSVDLAAGFWYAYTHAHAIFTNVRDQNGGIPITVFHLEAFDLDYKPFWLDSDQGRILLIHGSEDGLVYAGTRKMRLSEFLVKSNTPKGVWNLVSCFNGAKSDEELRMCQALGWEIIKIANFPTPSFSPVDCRGNMAVHGIQPDEAEAIKIVVESGFYHQENQIVSEPPQGL